MAHSNPSAGRPAPVAIALWLMLAIAAPAQSAERSQLPINLEAASSDFDYKNNTLLFKRVRITQGDMRVEAEEASATGLEFDNSEWRLQGSVQITVPDGRLDSSTATVKFRDNAITRAVINGAPARFEQKLKDTQQLAKGRAGSIEYDVQASTVRLQGDAWLSDGQNEIRGETLVYDIGRQRVVANPNEKDPGGVKITINPKPRETPPKEKTP